MKFTAAAACLVAMASTVVSAYPVTGSVLNCRASPDTSSAVKKTYKKGDNVDISCQTEGPSVEGNSIWDKTQDGCYVADFYVKTGSSGYVKDKCPGTKPPTNPPGGKIPGPMVNDYPYKGKCGPVDRWAYFACQCTSFVAWRINERLNIKFNNHYKGPNWGNANTWDEAARKTGVKVNKTPVPGCIAQTNKGGGGAGHVAWVTKVSGDKVTIEEYNYRNYRAYGTRTVPKSTFENYIHIQV